MSYRTVHVLALAALLALPAAAVAQAGGRPAHAVRPAGAAAAAPTAASWLDLLRAFWRGDSHPGNSGPGGGPQPGPPPHVDPPPEGSGLCPHGMMHMP